MYGALWRHIPGGLAGRLAGVVALAVAALALLFYVIFPAVEPHLPWNEVTVNTPTLPTQTVAPSAGPSSGLPSSSVLPSN
jgi:hypothetical protein